MRTAEMPKPRRGALGILTLACVCSALSGAYRLATGEPPDVAIAVTLLVGVTLAVLRSGER